MLKFIKALFIIFVCIPIAILTIITPMTAPAQYIFGVCMIGGCVLASHMSRKHAVSVALLVISVIMSSRYMYFRTTQTLQFASWFEAILGWMLYLAEIYVFIVQLLSTFQLCWSLKRKIVPLPADTRLWPTVDVYIPTYNESLKLVSDAVLACQCLEYPKDKLNIYILDDGRRKEFATFATEAGAGYITRNDNAHAKAGNLNHAMQLTHGEFIAIFDCDHICTKIFLQATVGAFLKDPRLALLQTPHHFYSPDPIERNLYLGRDIPSEGEMFYGPVQRGNDNWNAAFFCGSCAVIRRKALNEIHGFAVETVTEDAHTALRLQRRGWNTAYLDQILAGGLATERTILHIIQRNRWARGMVQIFRLDNPIFGRGLTFAQRLCYLSSTMYFFFGLPKVIFMVIPLLYLLFGLAIVHSSAAMMFAYALPHLLLSMYSASRVSGRYRYSFWGEIYDLLLSFHLVIPVILVLISPHKGKFNVTDKGGTIEKGYFDAHAVRPHLIMAGLLVIGIIFGIVKHFLPEYFEVQVSATILNVGWATYCLIMLTAAICVARETPNQRQRQRLDVQVPVLIYQKSGICSRSVMRDLSMTGCRIEGVRSPTAYLDDPITDLEISTSHTHVCVPVELVGQYTDDPDFLRFRFTDVNISTHREIVRLLFSRADAWVRPPRNRDNILRSFFTVLGCILDSFRHRRHDESISRRRDRRAIEEEEMIA